MRKVIAIDQDQVLANLFTPWVDAINKHENENVPYEAVKSWDICSYFECGKRVYDYLDYNMFRNLPVIEGSQRVVSKLMDIYDVFVVTTATSHPQSLLAKMEWLKEHFEFISPSNIVLCGSKSIIKADVMIDDGVHNLEVFDGIKLLFDACHNKDCDKFYRVNNWNDVEKILL